VRHLPARRQLSRQRHRGHPAHPDLRGHKVKLVCWVILGLLGWLALLATLALLAWLVRSEPAARPVPAVRLDPEDRKASLDRWAYLDLPVSQALKVEQDRQARRVSLGRLDHQALSDPQARHPRD